MNYILLILLIKITSVYALDDSIEHKLASEFEVEGYWKYRLLNENFEWQPQYYKVQYKNRNWRMIIYINENNLDYMDIGCDGTNIYFVVNNYVEYKLINWKITSIKTNTVPTCNAYVFPSIIPTLLMGKERLFWFAYFRHYYPDYSNSVYDLWYYGYTTPLAHIYSFTNKMSVHNSILKDSGAFIVDSNKLLKAHLLPFLKNTPDYGKKLDITKFAIGKTSCVYSQTFFLTPDKKYVPGDFILIGQCGIRPGETNYEFNPSWECSLIVTNVLFQTENNFNCMPELKSLAYINDNRFPQGEYY
ncbi:MAG: hypothetical protein ACPMAG_09070, partial [Limisphaerales bacterium]